MSKETELQKHYRAELAQVEAERRTQYQIRLEQFADDSIKTIRELKKNPDAETAQELMEAIELDWVELQRLKKLL